MPRDSTYIHGTRIDENVLFRREAPNPYLFPTKEPHVPDEQVADNLAEKLKQYPILSFFAYAHLPPHLQIISEPYHNLAWKRALDPHNNHPAEVAAGLRKLLEAKDCFVRAALPRS